MNNKQVISILETLPNFPVKVVKGTEYKEISKVSLENNTIVLYE